MAKQEGDLLRGTFDMLVLKSLSLGPMHGWGVAERIARLSNGVCDVQQGTVYPVLLQLLRRGWVVAEWRASETNRRARYYRLTASGKKQLAAQVSWWERATSGVDRVLRSASQES